MIYNHYRSIEEIPEKIQIQIQENNFKKTFEEIWQETKMHFERIGQKQEIDKANRNPKHEMALVFSGYFDYTAQLAFSGDVTDRVNYQVLTGPALGAFNQWVKGSDLEDWRARHVDQIGKRLMKEAAILLSESLQDLLKI
jgi:trans-AT polyketide synthase/acyltransferase/oxidoreductase domain-containing protein